jgi:hypothetical protein
MAQQSRARRLMRRAPGRPSAERRLPSDAGNATTDAPDSVWVLRWARFLHPGEAELFRMLSGTSQKVHTLR